MSKNPGFGARTGSVQAALAASRSGGRGAEDTAPANGNIVGVGIRMPDTLHQELRTISFETREFINSLLVAGAMKVVEAYKAGRLVHPQTGKVIVPPKPPREQQSAK